MKIYISGKISDLPMEEVKQKFEKAETFLKHQGMLPVNPLKIKANGTRWEDYMKADIKEMMSCEAIFMLLDHRESRGAAIELRIAQDLNFYILYENAGYYK